MVVERCSGLTLFWKSLTHLDFWVAGFVVDVQIAEETDAAVGLHEPTTRMGFESLSDDGILDSNIRGGSADGKGLVSAL